VSVKAGAVESKFCPGKITRKCFDGSFAKELIRAKGASSTIQNETYIEAIGIEAIGKSDITLGEVSTP